MTVGMITYYDQNMIYSHHDGWDQECGNAMYVVIYSSYMQLWLKHDYAENPA